jgi:hypothetical protein
MKRKVYLETSVISYLTARPSKTIIGAAHQQLTLSWWERRLAVLEGLDVLAITTRKADSEGHNAVRRIRFMRNAVRRIRFVRRAQ